MVPLLCEVHLLHFREPLLPSVAMCCLEQSVYCCCLVILFVCPFVFFLPAVVASVALVHLVTVESRKGFNQRLLLLLFQVLRRVTAALCGVV